MSYFLPLRGVRVLDLSRLLPGPFASMILADLGAQVDKLEDPHGGDWSRVTIPVADDGMGVMFHWINRGKRSIVLDLKQAGDQEILWNMLAHYDVLIESNRPGVMKKFGFDYSAVHTRYPKLIYCSMSGYGQTGPLADRAGHDLNYVTRAGLLGLTGPTQGPPQTPGGQIADIGGSLYAVIGILAALQNRTQTQEGVQLDISLTESALSFSTYGLAAHLGGLQSAPGQGSLAGGYATYRTYATQDGGAVSFAALEPKFWLSFCAGVGIEPDSNVIFPGPHHEALAQKLAQIFKSRTTQQWAEFAQKHDCCLEVIGSPDNVRNDEHFNARGVWVERKSTAGAPLWQPRTPVADAAQNPAPVRGQHTQEILQECKISDEKIQALLQRTSKNP